MPVSVKAIAAFLVPLLLLGGHAPATAKDSGPPVVDLRVGLSRTFERAGSSFWQGIGQGGIVQLRQGHVQGALLPFTEQPGVLSGAQLAVRFTRFRDALASTQAFDDRACAPGRARIGAWFELEAPELLASDPDEVATWVARGVRVISLAGKSDTALATSAFPNGGERATGLSAAGRRVAEVAMKAGALVDISHLSDAASLEVLELAKVLGRPVIATRGSARRVRSVPGSLEDWQLRAIAESGGVVALSLDRELIGEGGVDAALRQLDHLLQVAGPDALALASGYETGSVPTATLTSAARYPRLAAALVAHGFDLAQLRKLFSENARRVLCSP